MVLDLMGVPTEVPVYDQDGNVFQLPDQLDVDFTSESGDVRCERLLDLVQATLDEVDDIGTDLSLSEDVNVYDYDAEEVEGQEYYTVTLFGGKNGSGNWSNYLKVLADLMLRLESNFDDAWIRKMDIDVTDDVFSVEIAVLTWAGQLEQDNKLL